jgi:hypothetical protein
MRKVAGTVRLKTLPLVLTKLGYEFIGVSWFQYELTNSVALETQESSPHSQLPATCPYPQLVESTSHHLANFLKIQSGSILP